MSNAIEDRIKSSKLTRTEARIAEYIAGNLNAVCFMTASELAEKIGVSDASVIRLSRALGYKGFPHLQDALQENLADQLKNNDRQMLSPLEKLSRHTREVSAPELLKQCLDATIANITSVVNNNSLEKLDTLADTIIGSERKFVLGFRGCRGLADWMSILLTHMLPNVIKETSADSEAVEKLLDLSEKDCVILFSYHRYSSMAKKVARMARERKARLIVFTERLTAPVAQGADELVLSDVEGMTFFNSHVGVVFAMELILSIISRKIGTGNAGRLKFMEDYLKEMELY